MRADTRFDARRGPHAPLARPPRPRAPGRLPAAIAAALVAAVLVLGGPLETFADAIRRAVEADPAWVLGAATFELLSFAGYIAALWLVASRASARLGLKETTQITLGGAAATRLLPTAGVGGAAMTLWALRRSGLGTRGATGTLLTFLVLVYAVFLASIAVAGTVLAVTGDGPLVLTALPAALAPPAWCLPSPPPGGCRPRAPDACARSAPCSAARCGRPSVTCGRPTRACSARSPGGASTWRCSTGCSTRSARRPPSRSSCSPTSSARSPTPCRSRAPPAAASWACCSPSASRPTSRSSPCSPTAPWRSGSRPRSGSSPSGTCGAR